MPITQKTPPPAPTEDDAILVTHPRANAGEQRSLNNNMIPDREPISTGFSSGDAPSIVAPNVPGLQDGVAQAVSAVCESELADQVLDVSGEGLPAASSLLADIPQADIDRLAEALAKLLASWWRSQQAEADGASQAAVPEPLAA